MGKVTSSYVETAKAVISGELTKNTVTVEEIEFVCFYYFVDLENSSQKVNIKLLQAKDEKMIIDVSGEVLEVETIDLFLSINNNKRQDVIKLAQSSTATEFINNLNSMK